MSQGLERAREVFICSGHQDLWKNVDQKALLRICKFYKMDPQEVAEGILRMVYSRVDQAIKKKKKESSESPTSWFQRLMRKR